MNTENMREVSQKKILNQLRNPWYFRFFLLMKMPIALISGLRIRHIDNHSCTCSIPYKWFSQNPFKSLYFASQSMAAEMSTGALAMMKIQGYHPGISMLVLKMEGQFHKKGTQRIYFTCNAGEAIEQAIQQAVDTGEGVSVDVLTEGKTSDDILVSTFKFTWTFKVRSK